VNGDDRSMTKSFSQTEDSSFYYQGNDFLSYKPLETHQYSKKPSLSTPTASQITLSEEPSDSSFSDNPSIENSKSSLSTKAYNNNKANNINSNSKSNIVPMSNINIATGKLTQSVSTEITTIHEEDEDDVKAEHD